MVCGGKSVSFPVFYVMILIVFCPLFELESCTEVANNSLDIPPCRSPFFLDEVDDSQVGDEFACSI